MLTFKPITIECVYELAAFAHKLYTRSCDYTPGNLVMWARYMHYRYAVHNNTLFISCLSQMDMETRAFLLPIGDMPIEESIEILRRHCERYERELRFTAIPDDLLSTVTPLLRGHRLEQLDGWSDYLYNAESLATLQGKALNKKRNRYNKFMSQYPGYSYSRYTPEERNEVLSFLARKEECSDDSNMRCYEYFQSISTVKDLERYSQPAATLRVDGKIAAFTIGEIFGDTLYIHIEKAEREVAGAAEAINKMFAADMLQSHPQLRLINREEDLGNPGLRQAKRAYDPCTMIDRYEMIP